MKLPQAVKDIRTRYVNKFGIPSGTPETIEPIARAWSLGFAEQVAFELPGQGWGMKSSSPTNPMSKDTITQNGTPLICWDLLQGTGTGAPTLVEDPDSIDITGQTFIAVTPTDNIGDGGEQPQPDPADPELKAILLKMQQTLEGINAQVIRNEELIKQADFNNERRYRDLVAHFNALPAPPPYKGNFPSGAFGGTREVVITPIK